MLDFLALAATCAPMAHVQTMQALVKTESGFNPYAIGVVNGRLERQPRNLAEAVATADSLVQKNYNFSVGYAQINRWNFKKYGLTTRTAFEPCLNLNVGGRILQGCFTKAQAQFKSEQGALRAAFSCYYSGNFRTGFKADFKGQPSYVDKVVGNALGPRGAIRVHPMVTPMVTPQATPQATGAVATAPQAEGTTERSSLVF